METGRTLFSRFLKGEPLSRPPFVPLVRGLPARVDGTPFETITLDPTLWANSLNKTTDLFGFDGVVSGFFFSLLAEACGCTLEWEQDRPVVRAPSGPLTEAPEESPRMKSALDAAERVFSVCRTEKACVAAMTGPVTLASQLFGREDGPKRIGEVKHLVVRVTEAFCQTRPDVVIFMEGRPLALADVGLPHRRIYNTLKNILDYYNISAGLYLQGYQAGNLTRFSALKMNLYVLGPSLEGALPPIPDLVDLAADTLGVGLGLPLDDFDKAKQIIEEGLEIYRSRGGRGVFFTSFGPVTRDANLDALHQLVEAIHGLNL
jgi:hypothetical protein